jgi:hypothetical protein
MFRILKCTSATLRAVLTYCAHGAGGVLQLSEQLAAIISSTTENRYGSAELSLHLSGGEEMKVLSDEFDSAVTVLNDHLKALTGEAATAVDLEVILLYIDPVGGH